MEWNITPPDKDGIIKTPGIESGKAEWWYNSPLNLKFVKEGSIIVIKFHGGMFWSGRWEQKYSSTKFMVFRIKEVRSTDSYPVLYRCEEIIEFPLRKGKDST